MAWDVGTIVGGIFGSSGFAVLFGPRLLDMWNRRHPERDKKRRADQESIFAIKNEERAENKELREELVAWQANSNMWEKQARDSGLEVGRLQTLLRKANEQHDSELERLRKKGVPNVQPEQRPEDDRDRHAE